MRLLIVLLALFVQDQSTWTDADQARAEELLQKFYKGGDVAKELRKLRRIPPENIEALAKKIPEFSRAGAKLEDREGKLDHPKHKGRYLVKFPKEFDKAKAYPLLIGLHGGGQNLGDSEMAERAYGRIADGFNAICVFPEVLQQRYAEWGRSSDEAEYVNAVIDAALRTWKIDTNRIYMCGDSMGGYGTWHIGGYSADRLAACASHAGGILRFSRGQIPWAQGIIVNLRNTPIYFTHGAKDRPAPVGSDRRAHQILTDLNKDDPEGYLHEYEEFPDRGHSIPRPALDRANEYMFGFTRKAEPKKLVWETFYDWKRTFAWLAIEKVERGMRIDAEIKEGNRIEVTTKEIVDGFSIRLNRDLVNVTKAVTVIVNGEERFRGIPKPNLVALAESGLAIDPARVYPYEIFIAEEY